MFCRGFVGLCYNVFGFKGLRLRGLGFWGLELGSLESERWSALVLMNERNQVAVSERRRLESIKNI